MIPLDLAQLGEPRVIVEAVYAGVEREVRDEAFLSHLGEELGNYFRDYYCRHTGPLRWPRYFRYHHAQKLETLVQEIMKRSKSGNLVRVLDGLWHGLSVHNSRSPRS
jgi:hypothetical protein